MDEIILLLLIFTVPRDDTIWWCDNKDKKY